MFWLLKTINLKFVHLEISRQEISPKCHSLALAEPLGTLHRLYGAIGTLAPALRRDIGVRGDTNPHPTNTCACLMRRFSTSWSSNGSSVADVPSLVFAPPGAPSMFRSPSSSLAFPSAHTSDSTDGFWGHSVQRWPRKTRTRDLPSGTRRRACSRGSSTRGVRIRCQKRATITF